MTDSLPRAVAVTVAVPLFLGREAELRHLEDLIRRAAAGAGGAVVLRGEAGIGKSTLLDQVRVAAIDARVLAVAGSEFETGLPYAGLHQLCRSLLDSPEGHPQRAPLQVAFGLTEGTPDVLQIGLATGELLAAAAQERPLVCLVDDAHWLDPASMAVLTFAARRLGAAPITMIFTVREPAVASGLDDLPALPLGGLSERDARALLASTPGRRFDARVLSRVLAEARGNPLALRELPKAGGFAPAEAGSVPRRIERSFHARLAALSPGAAQLLTVASADPTGDPDLLWPAARLLPEIDVPRDSIEAVESGLVEFTTRVRFSHPIARSVVYHAATARSRYAAHRALAEVTDLRREPDRWAWHRAHAGADPDENVAADLEAAASRAGARGGLAAAAAFLRRAAERSVDAGERVRRTFAAVQAMIDAGQSEPAATLLATVDVDGLDETARAHADLLRGRAAFLQHIDDSGPEHMLRAARRLAPFDPEKSRRAYLDALEMALAVGRAAGVMDMVLAEARAILPAPPAPDLLSALALIGTGEHREAAPVLRSVLAGAEGEWRRRPALASMLAGELWDPEALDKIVTRLLADGRESGALPELRLGLALTAVAATLMGDFARAAAAIEEEAVIADALGLPPKGYPSLHLTALRGRRAEALAEFDAARGAATASGSGQLVANIDWARSILDNGSADYPAALAAASRAVAAGDLYLAGVSLPELVEAAVRTGDRAAAESALAALTKRATAAGTDCGLGVAAYSRALLSGVEDDYREALVRLDRTRAAPYQARARLLYGEWLRRAGRRRDASEQLRTAHELFATIGMTAFARRAADELRAAGARIRGRGEPGPGALTAQEQQVAALVATGATNKEIAARLYLSPRTIDAHLRGIFRKLGVSSRRQLRDLPDPGAGPGR
ncbi:AAA family ATPase [Natronosporangium hydrolyticum]|uniref:AAA family ATPase n=1 Tax=Natronosporangium hydrolyticum TaxID=2811111 RepID=A0A895YE51_9ACTN|nr:AAA family ATPase [Natronosporangium hydrolyticum]QSB12816.1 AAA family ATPase [Natronosporangium hydrolyticum]